MTACRKCACTTTGRVRSSASSTRPVVVHAHFRHAVIPHMATMTLTQVSTGVPELSNTLIDRWSASLLRKRTGPPVHDQQTNGPQPLGLTGDAHVMSY